MRLSLSLGMSTALIWKPLTDVLGPGGNIEGVRALVAETCDELPHHAKTSLDAHGIKSSMPRTDASGP